MLRDEISTGHSSPTDQRFLVGIRSFHNRNIYKIKPPITKPSFNIN